MEFLLIRGKRMDSWKWLLLALALLCLAPLSAAGERSLGANLDDGEINVTVFHSAGCSYCRHTLALLDEISAENSIVMVEKVDVYGSKENYERWVNAWKSFGYDPYYISVPLTVIEGTPIRGYNPGKIRQAIDSCVVTPDQNEACPADLNTEVVHHFLFGQIDIKGMSLPVIAAVLGAVDGFNPCAMLILAYLIMLIIETKDRRKMWLIVGTFLLASAVIYFLILTAFSMALGEIGRQPLLKLAIGVVAIGVGIFTIKNHIRKKELTCKVTGKGTRKKIMDKFRELLEQPTTLITLAWIVFLAFAINSIELGCSWFIPLIFSEQLAMNGITGLAALPYNLVYLFFFMLDDIILFGGAALTMTFVDVSERIVRIAGLIGGSVILLLGILMIFFPEALAFV